MSAIDSMNDPRVDTLLYALEVPEGVEFVAPTDVNWDTGICRITLHQGLLEGMGEIPGWGERHHAFVVMTADLTTFEEARAAVEPLLAAWGGRCRAGGQRGAANDLQVQERHRHR